MKRGQAFAQPWAFMEKFEVPSFDEPEVNYLTRWRIIQTPWCALYLHRMDRPDSRPTLHDHPWSFLSIVLRGGYDEMRLEPHARKKYQRVVRRMNVMRRDDAHYIERLHRTPTWTLLFVGARRRTWGYWRRDVSESAPQTAAAGDRGMWTWTPFDRDKNNELFEAALAARKAMK